MGERLRRRARAAAMVMLLAAAAMVTQGCVLETKTVIDVYKFVVPAPKGVNSEIGRMSFPFDYCIQPGTLRANALFTPDVVGLTSLVLTILILQANGIDVVDRHAFTLRPRNGRLRGSLAIEDEFCVQAGQIVLWKIKPVGAAIPALIQLESFFEYQAALE